MQIMTKKKSKVLAIVLALAMLLSCFSVMQGSVYAAENDKKAPYKAGDDISNAMFYIAIDADNNGSIQDEADQIYYYTFDEIKAFNDEVSYHYGNHGEGETSTVRGAKISSMLDNLSGFEVNETTKDWKIQYAEEDAFHATDDSSIDTVGSLTDENGVGNGAGIAQPSETIVGYECKMTYDVQNVNNVNDTEFQPFSTFVEASALRAYRQTNSANTSVLKNFVGIVISEDGDTLTGEIGYTTRAFSDEDTEMTIADDYEVCALLEGMVWPARPQHLAYADVSSINTMEFNGYNGVSTYVTAGTDTSQIINFYYTETPYFTIDNNGKAINYRRSDLIEGSETVPSVSSDPENKPCFGYYQPMYYRYQGQLLSKIVSPEAGMKVYIATNDGKLVDITAKLDQIFVAFSNTQSKKSNNQVEYNRKIVNYDYVQLVDLSTAAVVEAPLNEGGAGSIVESGNLPTTYEKASIIVTKAVAAPTGVTASANGYKAANISWKAVSGADGYIVYQATKGSSTYKAVKTIKSGKTVKAAVSGLKTGTTYSFKVKAYRTIPEGTLYSAYSSAKSVKPALAKGKITKTTTIKNSKATVTWKKISGTTKYQLTYGTNKKITKGKKTITTKSTKATVKKLKKGKTYYAKVRAYRTVDGKRVYGAYSAVKKIK